MASCSLSFHLVVVLFNHRLDLVDDDCSLETVVVHPLMQLRRALQVPGEPDPLLDQTSADSATVVWSALAPFSAVRKRSSSSVVMPLRRS